MINIEKNLAEFYGNKVSFSSKIHCFIELSDRVIFLVDWYTDRFNSSKKHVTEAIESDRVYNNIFCYSLNDGKLLWQVDHRHADGEIIKDDVFSGISFIINEDKEGEEWDSSNKNSKMIAKNFNLNTDLIRVNVLRGWGYKLDPLTGKTSFLYQAK